MITGQSASEGTANFATKNQSVGKGHFRQFLGLTLSSIGIGTYLGDADNATDLLVKEAIKRSVLSGVNVIDTAINYRSQKAERSVGKAISELVEEGKVKREELFVSTKNGYVTNDADVKDEFWEYINKTLVKTGIIKSNDISSGYHCMTVPYLENQLKTSLKNLGFDCIDLMYLHNAAEGQLQDISKEEFMKNLKQVFEFYEKQRKEGTVKYYGMATWDCFRVPKENSQHLLLKDILKLAKEAGGNENGFKFIQLPYNMYLDQALTMPNQTVDGKETSILGAAKNLEIGVFASVPLMQAKLLGPNVIPEFGGLKPAHRALQFVRSTPGIIAPLVGQKSSSHVDENLELVKISPMSESEFNELVKSLTS
ncbi:MAG TPA: aldo/keto reductase [Nitrosopumilaceae archaeon]|nr:aldo/keto reductase [Nitrosopumilaceae archaeon]